MSGKSTDAEKGLLEVNDANNVYVDSFKKKQKHETHVQIIKLGLMIVMTFVVFLVELFYGYISNSVALIADSFHMLSDLLALSVALACILVRFEANLMNISFADFQNKVEKQHVWMGTCRSRWCLG
jgi:hypothetical protein